MDGSVKYIKYMKEWQKCITSEGMGEANEQTSHKLLEQVNIQWNLSVTTTSKINLITCDLFSNVF